MSNMMMTSTGEMSHRGCVQQRACLLTCLCCVFSVIALICQKVPLASVKKLRKFLLKDLRAVIR